nr:B12-binding domain-containing protein [Winogradskyella ouciana]
MSMLNFDQTLFYNTYNGLLKEKPFDAIFYDIFIPLLTEIGLLWQTDTITPAHEHFLSSLIRQKILINTEKIQSKQVNKSKKTFVLYLPENEIHELGLMFINHQLVSKGYQSIFLGFSVPLESLVDLKNYYDEIIYISYFTVKPEKDNIEKYINDFNNLLVGKTNTKLWILGQMLNSLDLDNLPEGIEAYKSIQALLDNV